MKIDEVNKMLLEDNSLKFYSKKLDAMVCNGAIVYEEHLTVDDWEVLK